MLSFFKFILLLLLLCLFIISLFRLFYNFLFEELTLINSILCVIKLVFLIRIFSYAIGFIDGEELVIYGKSKYFILYIAFIYIARIRGKNYTLSGSTHRIYLSKDFCYSSIFYINKYRLVERLIHFSTILNILYICFFLYNFLYLKSYNYLSIAILLLALYYLVHDSSLILYKQIDQNISAKFNNENILIGDVIAKVVQNRIKDLKLNFKINSTIRQVLTVGLILIPIILEC